MVIPLFKVFMGETVRDAVADVLYSGYIGEGRRVLELERIVEKRLSLWHVLAVNNGTAGLHLAYHMSKSITGKSKAIVSPMTCLATVSPLIATGVEVVWADVDPLTGNIDPDDVARKMDQDVGMVVLVHWGGVPCLLDRFLELQKGGRFMLVEDAAHALGAEYGGKPVGSFADFTMFSLQAIKHITSVDGGLLVCRREEDYNRGKLLRWYGIDRTVKTCDFRCSLDVPEVGYKFHMNDVNAAIGIENFAHLDWILKKVRENAAFYNQAFHGTQVRVGSIPTVANPSYWLYTVCVSNSEELRRELGVAGIETSKVHSRLDYHSALGRFKTYLPGVDAFAESHLCIPVGWWVSDQDRIRIAETVVKYARG